LRADRPDIVAAPPPVVVVDTVGAGDAFTAGFLAHLAHHHRLYPGALARADDHEIKAALDLANRVAAMTCGRAGADPPHLSDL